MDCDLPLPPPKKTPSNTAAWPFACAKLTQSFWDHEIEVETYTLPETNSLPLKISGWETILSFWEKACCFRSSLVSPHNLRFYSCHLFYTLIPSTSKKAKFKKNNVYSPPIFLKPGWHGIGCMFFLLTYIYHTNQPNVGKYTIYIYIYMYIMYIPYMDLMGIDARIFAFFLNIELIVLLPRHHWLPESLPHRHHEVLRWHPEKGKLEVAYGVIRNIWYELISKYKHLVSQVKTRATHTNKSHISKYIYIYDMLKYAISRKKLCIYIVVDKYLEHVLEKFPRCSIFEVSTLRTLYLEHLWFRTSNSFDTPSSKFWLINNSVCLGKPTLRTFYIMALLFCLPRQEECHLWMHMSCFCY